MDNKRLSLRLSFSSVQRQPPETDSLQTTPNVLEFSPGCSHKISALDLEDRGVIGTGNFGGVVTKMICKNTGNLMAVKKIRANEINAEERTKMLRELKIIVQSQNCSDIIKFFGALFHDGECWICMEILDCSLDKFYQLVYKQNMRLPEEIVGFITASVVRALNYLKSELNIIHRDVKPSNILLDGKGFVKLCDFGISGYLVDSIAKTQDVGCQIYMAPERLAERRYDIRSDVWSLGISLVEICVGHFPYVGWNTVFDQLQSVVNGDPPFLTANFYSVNLCSFVNQCLIKDTNSRPKFNELMNHSFFQRYNFTDKPEAMGEERKEFGTYVRKFVPSWEEQDCQS